jgi:hypothetical protein
MLKEIWERFSVQFARLELILNLLKDPNYFVDWTENFPSDFM